jgi:hypothetical protein
LFAAITQPAVEDLDGNTVLAPILVDLMAKVLERMDAQSSVELYQILISNLRWHYATLTDLSVLLETGTLLDHPLAYDYFLWMLLSAPDECPVKFALYQRNLRIFSVSDISRCIHQYWVEPPFQHGV